MMRPKRKVRGSPGAAAGPVAQFFNFLVPPVSPKRFTDGDEMELSDFTREMQYADSWRELRMLVDVIADQLNTGQSPGMRGGYATFMLEREGKYMLMGVKANESGDEIHITHQVMNKYGRNTGDPAMVTLVFDDIEEDAPTEVRNR